jgi:hypothetical protein
MIADSQLSISAPGRSDVIAALQKASSETGSDFGYLLATATRESNLQADAKARNSSATGLFQFIDQTWLSLVKRYGAEHGLEQYADAIRQNGDGRCTVASAEMKSAILALRKNPQFSAMMAGEAAQETKQSLECSLGREVSCGELYAAHFLGQGGARKLISLYEADPDQRADLAFPEAARANRSVFYHKDGTAKSIGELYSWSTSLPKAAAGPAVRAHSDAREQTASSQPELKPLVFAKEDNDESTACVPVGGRFAAMAYTPVARAAALPPRLPQPPLMMNAGVVQLLATFGISGLLVPHSED